MMSPKKKFNIPILLLTWKREKEIASIINKLREINAVNIYINSDGYDFNLPKTKISKKIIRTRNLILKKINWDCKLKLKFNSKNLGCKNSVTEAINWFFDNEDLGIILEEDCIPDNSFFFYCAELLKKYKNNKEISCITGVNFQDGRKITNTSYYYSKYNHCWGWATWKKSWQIYDKNMKFWPSMKLLEAWDIDKSMSRKERNYWEDIFERSYLNKIDSWAYPWLASLWYKNQLTITPEYNLVSNVGFDGLATHTKNRFSRFAKNRTYKLKKIIHNPLIKINIEADKYTFKTHFYETYDLNLKGKLRQKVRLLIKIALNPKEGFLYFRDKFFN